MIGKHKGNIILTWNKDMKIKENQMYDFTSTSKLAKRKVI